MKKISRHEFLKMGAAALGATASFAALPASIQRALAIPARKVEGTIQDVQHVVILMQENRSFDHYFGSLGGVRGFDDAATLPIAGQASVFQQPNGGNGFIEPFHVDSSVTNGLSMGSLAHGWTDGHNAWNGGRWDNWVAAKSGRTLGYFTRADLPFHYALADAFTLCDQYFSACMGPTNPNRVHLFSGMLDIGATGGGPLLDNNPQNGLLTWRTYVERLQDAGVSWRVYQGSVGDEPFKTALTPTPFGDLDYPNPYNQMRFFANIANAPADSPLAQVLAKRTYAQLVADVAADQLAQVSWLMPAAWCSEHPFYTPADGATYIAAILDALTSNPAVWAKTVLFICYDENDGIFDHVVPPGPPVGPSGGLSNVPTDGELFVSSPFYAGFPAGPIGLGTRVPMLAISPWSKGAWTCSEVFDHTSVIRFLEQRFGVQEPNITPWRRAVCGDLTSAFDFAHPDSAAVSVPSVAGLVDIANAHANFPGVMVPAVQSMPRQEAGSRRLRATPYRLHVDAAVEPKKQKLKLKFANQSAAGAVFQVYSAVAPSSVKRYTASAGTHLVDSWDFQAAGADGRRYDLTVTGPNGFLRGFTGSAGTALQEATAREVRPAGNLELSLSNPGKGTCTFQVRDNRYGQPTLVTRVLASGATLAVPLDLSASHQWYDVTVTSSIDPSFSRRFAGHVETGAPGVSDPGSARA